MAWSSCPHPRRRRGIQPMLDHFWASAVDGWSTLIQQFVFSGMLILSSTQEAAATAELSLQAIRSGTRRRAGLPLGQRLRRWPNVKPALRLVPATLTRCWTCCGWENTVSDTQRKGRGVDVIRRHSDLSSSLHTSLRCLTPASHDKPKGSNCWLIK